MVEGESGTGKELVARRLHHLSDRARRPFIRVNSAAIPEELIESELFGHEKGSFTGAHRRQVGKFVQADGGTIFLDEVGDMSLKTQAKVLRVLQDGEVEPVGAAEPLPGRCAGHRRHQQGPDVRRSRWATFREDLYYRSGGGGAHAHRRCANTRKTSDPGRAPHRSVLPGVQPAPKTWSDEALDQLRRHLWPGNVRELKNVVERAVIMELDDTVVRVDRAHPAGDVAAGWTPCSIWPSLQEFQRSPRLPTASP